MILSDVLISLQWWMVLFVLGLLFTPLTAFLFPNFLDKGYSFAKTVGILTLSYAMFVAGTLHVLPFSFASLLILLLIFGGVSYLTARQFHLPLFEFKQTIQKNLRWIITEELIFLVVFFLWVYIRSFNPDINGLEKFMDFGFVNSILRSDYFPARDMWFTPFSINYYYFGHFITAVLTKLSFLSSNYTYNLMIATLCGLAFVSSFSISANLYKQCMQKKYFLKVLSAGILTASIVTFAGNLHTLYTFFKPYQNENPVPMTKLIFSPQTFPNAYWYPNATRFIHNTIHEFPIYSWTVSDLHGHVADIPFVLLTIAFVFSLFLRYRHKEHKLLPHKNQKKLAYYYHFFTHKLPIPIWHMLYVSLLLAVMYMTNAWDGIIYFLLSLLLIAYLEWQQINKTKASLLAKLLTLGAELIIPVVVIVGGFVLFSLPFSLSFKPFVSGIGVLCAPDILTNIGRLGPFLFEPNHCQRSPLWQLAILYGFFFFFAVIFFFLILRKKKWFTSDIFAFLLFSLSTLLILIPEFIYAKDIYPAHYRANTMFKLVFQAFIMLSLTTGYSLSRILTILRQGTTSFYRKTGYFVFFVVSLGFLTLVFLYPYFAIMSYYGELKSYKGLDGTAYLKQRYPHDAQAIAWLNVSIKGQPVILEAQGDSYTDYARISANTGLPTVLGWTVHEWLWRGSYDIPAPRIEEIKQMYEVEDRKQTKDLLKKYHVQYIFLGELERQKYTVNEEKFEKLGKVIYQNGTTKIYKVQ